MTDTTKNLFDVIFSFLQLLGATAAAGWAYFRFFHEGTHRPRIEFDIQCTFYRPQGNARGAMFAAQIVNKGTVEHKFTRITLKLRGVRRGEPLMRMEDQKWEFPESLLKAELVPPKFGYFFVRPGISQSITFPTTLDSRIAFVLAHAAFIYEGSEDMHTVEKVFEVPLDWSTSADGAPDPDSMDPAEI